MAPKRFQYEPEGHLKGPNMSQKGAKMSTKGPKGRSKVTPKATKIPQENTTSKKIEKGGAREHLLGSFLTYFCSKNASKNLCEKRCEKRLQKSRNLSKKQGTIPSQEMHFLIGCLQRRFLQNSVFTREKQCVLKIPCFESVHTFEKHPRKK